MYNIYNNVSSNVSSNASAFYFMVTDKTALENYNNSVVKRLDFNKKPLNLNGCGLWGVTSGPHNDGEFAKINSGDYCFFRGTNDKQEQVFLGIACINKKVENGSQLSLTTWNDPTYTNIVFLDEFYEFDQPLVISKNYIKTLDSRITDPPFNPDDFHKAYNMFRKWNVGDPQQLIKDMLQL